MPPMDSSAYPLFDPGSWPFISTNCPDFLDVKTEDGSFCSGPLVGSAISSSNGESCMSKVEQVVGQRSVNNFSSGPGLSSFARGNPIVSESLMHGGLDYVAPSECASSTASSAQRVDSGELPSVYTDELASVFSNVTSVQRGDSCLIELASAFPTGEALSDPPPSSCATTAVGAIAVTRTDDQQPQMSGMTGIGGTSHSMPVLNAVLPTIVADKSRQSITLSGPMLFKVPFAGIGMPAGENSRPKRRNVKISKDPQSVAARHRRERISDRISTLKKLVPGGTKMDTASMLDEAINYVKYLKAQVQTMETVNVASNCFDPYGSGPFYRNNMAGLGEAENFAMGCRGRTMQPIGSGLNYPL